MSEDLKFLISLVKGASNLITEDFQVKAKGDNGDLVTNLDYEVEKYIIEEIKENYPEFSIVSEEYNSNKELTDNCFTIDPIDGTINFANNIPLWGIQVACIRNKKTCAAVIYLPKLNEIYYADENGAFMNDKPIQVNNLSSDKGLYTIAGIGKEVRQVKMRKTNPHYRQFYCCAVNFAWVASGRLSAASFVKDTAWDYIPGLFIVEQAGGVIFNDDKIHIAANNKDFLEIMKNNSKINDDEEVIIVKK